MKKRTIEKRRTGMNTHVNNPNLKLLRLDSELCSIRDDSLSTTQSMIKGNGAARSYSDAEFLRTPSWTLDDRGGVARTTPPR